MSLSLTVGGKKKRKTPRVDQEQKQGIRLVVQSITLIEPCDEPGIHIETPSSIRKIDGIDFEMIMTDSIKFVIESPCPLVIEKTGGGIGVLESNGGSVLMN